MGPIDNFSQYESGIAQQFLTRKTFSHTGRTANKKNEREWHEGKGVEELALILNVYHYNLKIKGM